MTSSTTRRPHRRPGAPASRETGDLIARQRENDARRPGGEPPRVGALGSVGGRIGGPESNR